MEARNKDIEMSNVTTKGTTNLDKGSMLDVWEADITFDLHLMAGLLICCSFFPVQQTLPYIWTGVEISQATRPPRMLYISLISQLK